MDLAAHGIFLELPFLIWEWTTDSAGGLRTNSGAYFEDQFANGGGDLQLFPVNNEFQPTYALPLNATVHVRLVCAQTTTGSALWIQSEATGQLVPFYAFASDGISYDRAYPKSMVVIGPGQREGLLLQFTTPGTYRVMQGILNDFQGYGYTGIGPDVPNRTDQLLASFTVAATGASPAVPVDLSTLTFTPGMGTGVAAEISPDEITTQWGVRFEVQSDVTKMPSPQFVINDQEFDVKRIVREVPARGSAQWTLTSNMNYFHPFHIHVNPFVVKQQVSGFLPGGATFRHAVFNTNLEPTNMWRDTIFIPPLGSVTIWQHFGNNRNNSWIGKTVFHCHFLDHEDQGMIAAFMITGGDQAHSDGGTLEDILRVDEWAREQVKAAAAKLDSAPILL